MGVVWLLLPLALQLGAKSLQLPLLVGSYHGFWQG